MIKLLSVAIFAGLFFASQAISDPNITFPDEQGIPFELVRRVQPCLTKWFDRDDPSGTGDWETLSRLRKENPGQICSQPEAIEAQTLDGLSVEEAEDVIYKRDTTYGFVCRKRDQPKKICHDYRVRFICPMSFCQPKECWTKWFDRDNPSGSGDWETLYWLRKENPGQICHKPAAIEAQTLTGLSVVAAGDVIYKSDTTYGFACRNRDQPNKICHDYRVRFSCPASFCEECWTMWFDRDNPSGTGDWETLYSLHKEHPGRICPKPAAIEAQTLTGLSVVAAGDVIYKSDTTYGFACRKNDQPNKICQDYRVRFSCPPSYCEPKVCWTRWYDRDDPSGTGDWETLSLLRSANPGQICKNPLYIKAVTTDTNTPATSTGDIIYISSPSIGFVCRKNDQENRRCHDYKVQFGCPCQKRALSPEQTDG